MKHDESPKDPQVIFTSRDAWVAIAAGLELEERSSELGELAGRIAVLLPKDDLGPLFESWIRKLLDEGRWDLIGALLDGAAGAWPSLQIPVSTEIIAELMSCPDKQVRELAIRLLSSLHRGDH